MTRTWTSLFPAVLRNRIGGLLAGGGGPEHWMARRKEKARTGMWGWEYKKWGEANS